jgi:cell wall-associated NlpC family hydrolase
VTLREQIVAESTSWIGTPYVDHQGLKHCGTDCAFFPLRICQAVGRAPLDFKVPYYSPQQWINGRSQIDKMKLRVVDTTMEDIVLRLAKREITEAEALPGDFVLYKVVASWTHLAVIIRWPDYVLHPIKHIGVCGSHGTNEGFWARTPRRFFSILNEGEE